jgi:hypothetical protein
MHRLSHENDADREVLLDALQRVGVCSRRSAAAGEGGAAQ